MAVALSQSLEVFPCRPQLIFDKNASMNDLDFPWFALLPGFDCSIALLVTKVMVMWAPCGENAG